MELQTSFLSYWTQATAWPLYNIISHAHLLQILSTGFAVTLAFVLLVYLVSPTIDAREPLPVWPRVPLIGHVLSLISHKSNFHLSLQCATSFVLAVGESLNFSIKQSEASAPYHHSTYTEQKDVCYLLAHARYRGYEERTHQSRPDCVRV
jgi:hypothetical protein